MGTLLNSSSSFQTHEALPGVQTNPKRLNLFILLSSVLLVYFISSSIYRLRFHPLSKYPGPPLAATTIKQYEYHFVKGDFVQWIHTLHDRYGDVVRYSPNHLSFTTPQAWKDIYGHRTVSRQANPKNKAFKQPPMDGHCSVIAEEDESLHGRQRKIFSHAFSDRALMEQEGLIGHYIDQLIELIRKRVSNDPNGNPALEMVQLYNWATFDIIGDLTFGEPLDNLANGKNSPWIDLIFTNFKGLQISQVLQHYQILSWLMYMCTPKRVLEEGDTHARNSRDSVTRRLEKKNTARPDIWGLVLKHEGENRMPRGQMDANSFLFMLAGSETTATLLSGATWLLMKNRDKYDKLVKEVRSVDKESNLTADRVRHMKYLVAVLEEALRWYPPVPIGLQRDIPKGGNRVLEDLLPEKTVVSVPSYSTSHSPHNFLHPDKFVPERWIFEETEYKEYHEYDKREALQPFSTGPRNCLGKKHVNTPNIHVRNSRLTVHSFLHSLAYYEMRAILARVIFNFDLKLCPESDNWGVGQKNWTLWDKPKLMVRVIERK
ncbi:cytochrome P450 [Zopfia rhizophila CBS 207.26]|uniref:Cytochrome P450 n=1 Tax=Zopfia rhizophila CBS 207.26 TaxID=1314779 RepID=A0A6A6DPG1_9PEZI|nr:cytochrome P450 [Zopfia rhizophila CBS 207.26]